MSSTFDNVQWALRYFVNKDKANAAIHCGPVRYSPITFGLHDALAKLLPDGEDITPEMAEVRQHQGQYERDEGR